MIKINWVARDVKDQNVEFPYRYNIKDINTGNIIATYDIEPDFGIIYQQGTEINKNYLQPIEDFLKIVNDALEYQGIEIKNIKNTLNTKAPKQNAYLIDATANTPPQNDNSNKIATTSFVKQYLDSLFNSF